MKTAVWKPNHRFTLLENGEAFYPRVFDAIRAARREVLIETFILFDDKVGQQLRQVMIEAANRGVRVEITVDGYGSPDLSKEFIGGLTSAGVKFHIFEPARKLFGLRTNVFRRLHRKLVVVDGERAFVGGINYSIDHLSEFGPQAKQDYAVEVEGPIVDDIRNFIESVLQGKRMRRPDNYRAWRKIGTTQPIGDAGWASLVIRDNGQHRNDIEQHYREAIRAARHQIIIANAYFFPGFRLLMELRRAARRGVRVMLILQGEPDMVIAKWAARQLYNYLLNAGVEIHEYCRRPLHGKVALADDMWATVGSSNLDPLSLALNLEANLVIRDSGFNHHLRERLNHLMKNECKQFRPENLPRRNWWQISTGFLVFHFLRRFPSWAGWLPGHGSRIETVRAEDDDKHLGQMREKPWRA